MNWEAIGSAGEVIGAVAVFLTLLYLARQIRDNTRALSAQSRHSLSDFARELSQFRAEHADRFAHIESGEPLRVRAISNSVSGATCRSRSTRKPISASTSSASCPNITGAASASFSKTIQRRPGFAEFWEATGYAFSEHFRNWLNKSIDTKQSGNGARCGLTKAPPMVKAPGIRQNDALGIRGTR